MSIGTATAESQLSVTLSSDEISLFDEVQVFGSVEWDQSDLLTDVYLAVLDDTGTIRFFYPGCPAPQTRATPFRGQLFLPQGYAIDDYFLARFCGEMLAFSSVPGTYWMVLALTRRGYLDLACEPAFAELRITRVRLRTWRDNGPNYATFEYIDHRWYLIKVNLEINHTWSTYINGESSSGSDIKYFVRQEHRELDDDGYGEITWHEGPANGNGLYVNLHVYQDHASVYAYGYDRQTLPPNGARIENWSLSTTLRP